MSAIRVYEQGTSKVVIGTDDAHEACRAVGITPETHRWCCTDFGWFVRRKGEWKLASEPPYRPKDAKIGVRFVGPIRLSRCPVHDLPDCSPLLNGCSELTR